MGVFVRVVFDRGVFYMGVFGLDPPTSFGKKIFLWQFDSIQIPYYGDLYDFNGAIIRGQIIKVFQNEI